MFTLKIRWQRHARKSTEHYVHTTTNAGFTPEDDSTYTQHIDSLEDEAVKFILCERVTVHGIKGVDAWDSMTKWDRNDFNDHRSFTLVDEGDTGRHEYQPGVLVEVELDTGDREWHLVSEAWLLGVDGQTIERIAP